MSIFCSPDVGKIIPFLFYSTTGLSIFASILVLITSILLSKLRNNWFMRYLAYLNLSNLFNTFAVTLLYHDIFITQSIPQNESFIVIHLAFFCSRYSSFIWPLILAINLYQMIVAKRSNNLSRYEFFWLFIGFVIPIIVVFILNCFGLIQFQQNFTLIFIEIVIPIVLMIFFTFFAYIKLAKASKSAFGEEEAKKMMKMILPYSIAIIVMSVPTCAYNILHLSSECFTFLSGMLLPFRGLQGTIDAIVFSFNPAVREEMRKYFRERNETTEVILRIKSINYIKSRILFDIC